MGMVAMKSRSLGFLDGGYPVVEATLYVYCDSCGSFNIRKHIVFWKWLIIVFVLVMIVFAVLRDGEILVCVLGISLFALILPWKDILLSYKCRKCGNQRITDSNLLYYQPYDESLVDVPDHLIQKR